MLTTFGSSEDIKNNLLELQSELNQSILKVIVISGDDYTGYALRKLSVYASCQLENLLSFFEAPIEFKAWISRNLFETYLNSIYITSDPSNAKSFVTQKASDELDIYQGIISIESMGDTDAIKKPIQDRIQDIQNTLVKYNLKQSKALRISELAKKTGNKDEYDAFYKLYSKYVHPTSWTIIAEKSEIDNPTIRNMFLIQTQFYTGCLLKIFSDYINKQV